MIEACVLDLVLKAAEAEEKARQAQEQFGLSVQDAEGKIAETQARIEKIYAEIQLAQQQLGLAAHREEREDVKTAADIEARQSDQALAAEGAQAERAFRERGEERADRQQQFSERQGGADG